MKSGRPLCEQCTPTTGAIVITRITGTFPCSRCKRPTDRLVRESGK